jgi:hypothetical protein
MKPSTQFKAPVLVRDIIRRLDGQAKRAGRTVWINDDNTEGAIYPGSEH